MRRHKILIVEDDCLHAAYSATVLSDAGFAVGETAHTVSRAVLLLEEAPPSAALLDFHLGKELVCLLGLELHSRGVPVVVVSGYPEEIACAQMPFRSAFLPKPAKAEELVAALTEAIRSGTAVLPDFGERSRERDVVLTDWTVVSKNTEAPSISAPPCGRVAVQISGRRGSADLNDRTRDGQPAEEVD